MKNIAKKLLPIADLVVFPFVYPAALILKNIRRAGVHRLPLCKKALLQVGVFPIRNHYYEPLIDSRQLTRPLSEDRNLPGIDWNVNEQLSILKDFSFEHELNHLPLEKTDNFVLEQEPLIHW